MLEIGPFCVGSSSFVGKATLPKRDEKRPKIRFKKKDATARRTPDLAFLKFPQRQSRSRARTLSNARPDENTRLAHVGRDPAAQGGRRYPRDVQMPPKKYQRTQREPAGCLVNAPLGGPSGVSALARGSAFAVTFEAHAGLDSNYSVKARASRLSSFRV